MEKLLVGLLETVICLPLALQTSAANIEINSEDYSVARKHFQTHLVKHGPAPQEWAPLRTPVNALQVEYSKNPPLVAWISTTNKTSTQNSKRAAVLFLHGGFATDTDDWDMNLPFREAGFRVMMPILRGENGQHGDYTMLYDEVEDVLAASRFLAAQPGVDTNHLYLAGHSVGGTLVMLTAMTTDRFRAAASFSGSPDQAEWTKGQEQFIPFDRNDRREFQMRSPLAFATSFKCPARLYYGAKEIFFDALTRRTATLAKQKNLDVEAIAVPGDHFGAVPEEIRRSIEFFQSRR